MQRALLQPRPKYSLPKRADGTFFPIPLVPRGRATTVRHVVERQVDLSAAFKAYDDTTLRYSGYNDTPQPAYYYYKTGGSVPITASIPCPASTPM